MMKNNIQRNEWIFGYITNPTLNRDFMVRTEIIKMLNKTTSMFRYKNLPETIRAKDLEIQLQVGGYAIWAEKDGKLYTFRGGLGGEPNPYYLPTIATVANPALRFEKNLKIDENCVVMLNDHFYEGFMPIHSKYANLLVEAELTLKRVLIHSRIPALISADNDNTFDSAVDFLNQIEEGTKFGVISGADLIDGIKTHEFLKIPHIKDTIESIQYIKGSWYNEVGLTSAFNMKREAINEAEATLNEDILKPVIDTLFDCRRFGLEKVNKMFDYNISVELNSVWEQNKEQENLSLEIMRKETEIDEIEGNN